MLTAALVGALLCLATMARRGSKRKFRRYLRGNINISKALGTLAQTVGILQSVSDVVEDTTWCSSIKCQYAMNNWTGVINAGPIQVYVAHSDYSLQEIEAYIESTASWDQGDKIAQEVRSRKIRHVGQFYPQGGSGAAATNDMNGGRFVRTKIGWMLSEGDTLTFCFYNGGQVAVGTTDPVVEIMGHANLWPVS